MKQIIKERGLPPLKSKSEMLEILQREEYGFIPPPPDKISFSMTQLRTDNAFAGKAKLWEIKIDTVIKDKEFSFPVSLVLPAGEGPFPFIVTINFEKSVPNFYYPAEEVLDNGFACFNLYFKDVTSDDGDFTNGLAGIYYPDGVRKNETDCGKIALWAWAASRCLDFAETLPQLDMSRAAVCGHSRLGKTALFAGATDNRFRFVHSNDSGCSGASIARKNKGETIADIHRTFWYWFSESYRKYCGNEDSMPFDQHYLIASIAPNYVSVGSAHEDAWADPENEQLACFAASEAFEREGLRGFVCEKKAEIGDKFFEGEIGYYLRKGRHYFSREDWNCFIEFINTKK